MHKTMVFIDYQNFNINLQKHYRGSEGRFKNVNYNDLGKEINKLLPLTSEVIKTYLFAYKPCEELMQLESYSKYYSWLEKMRNIHYLEIIEGRQVIRKIEGTEFNINDPGTYTTEEKETDINLATHMIAKGFQNAYDIAILVSGDTDYVSVIKTLHDLGKIIVLAHFPHQNVSKYQGLIDDEIELTDDLLDQAAVKHSKTKK